MKIQKAIVNVSLLKKDYFISSFPAKIVFGEVDAFEYLKNRYFIIHRINFCKFYEQIIFILESVCSDTEVKGILLQDENVTYGFCAKNSASFFIELQNELVYKTCFTINEINNMMDCFKEILTSTLLLKDYEIDFFKTTSNLDLETLKSFEDQNVVQEYVKKLNSPDNVKCIIISLNLDLIILLHKLSMLISQSYRKELYSGLLKTAPQRKK